MAAPGGETRHLRALDTTYVYPGAAEGAAAATGPCVVAGWEAGKGGCTCLAAFSLSALHRSLPSARLLPLPTAGLALGVMMSRSTRVREDMFIDAARALARLVPEADREAGSLMPPVTALRDVAGAPLSFAAAGAGAGAADALVWRQGADARATRSHRNRR